MSDSENVAKTIPAATVLIVRDGANGMEVFMVKRHHQIDFVAGALVFPGGKASKGDYEAGLSDYTDGGEDWDADMRALAAASIRESFEEAGILFAREPGSDELISEERLLAMDHYRPLLEKGEVTLLEMLKKEDLRICCNRLVHFAHWITPKNMPKRFDTHFFLAAAPKGHTGRHDGHESVDSVWIQPAEAIADRKKWNVIFPTKLNLMKLAQANSVDEAIEIARNNPPLTVEPWVEQGENGPMLHIRKDAGYEQTSTMLRDAT